jgi:LysR family transcriptional regulator, nod-box dependent transcriptional activator
MQLNRFDLNLLRSLDALLTERNVTRAAEKLFVTQQAMSGTLAKLRDYFEDQLLVRVGRQLELTPLARALTQPVREALLQIQSALDTRPSFDPARARCEFRFAMTDYVSLVFLPNVLGELAREAPSIRCHVESLRVSSFQRLESGEVDFCIGADDGGLYGSHAAGPEIRTHPLFEDDFVCVVDRQHPVVGEHLSMEVYQSLRHNLVRFGSDVATIVERGWRRAGLDMNVLATAPSFAELLFMLPGTPFIATAQRRLARLLANSLPLRLIECPLKLPCLHETLFWHARNETDPRHRYVRDVIARAAIALNESPGSAATSPTDTWQSHR